MARRSQGGKLQLCLEFPLFSLVRASDATAQGQKDKTGKTKDADLLHHDSPPLVIVIWNGTILWREYNLFFQGAFRDFNGLESLLHRSPATASIY
jgi:hypothetical protein